MAKRPRFNKNGEPSKAGTNPNSLANLAPPIKPGQVLNPTGKNNVEYQPFTTAIRKLASELLPEHLRLAMNIQMRNQLYATLKGRVRKIEDIPDMFQKGITWAGANAVRLHVSAIVAANIAASLEIREAVEGRATSRIEVTTRVDKLDALLDAFQRVADQDAVDGEIIDLTVIPPTIPPDGNGSGNT